MASSHLLWDEVEARVHANQHHFNFGESLGHDARQRDVVTNTTIAARGSPREAAEGRREHMRSGNSECIDSLTPARQRTHRSQLSADHKHRFCAGSDSLQSWRAAQQWEEIVAARQGPTLQHCESLPLPPVAHAVEPCERSRIIDARFVETAARAAVPRSGPRSAVRHSRAAPPRRCNMH